MVKVSHAKVKKKEPMRFFVAQVFDICITTPLRALFYKGPTWFGGWQGKSHDDICAEMTSNSATFWRDHIDECRELLEKKFQSCLIMFQVVVYGYLLCTTVHSLLRACVFRWTVTMPLERMLVNAGSTVRHIAHRLPAHSSPRRHSEAAPSSCKFLDCDISDTEPMQSGPPH